VEVDLEELAAIIELLDKTEFTQFRFEKGELRIAVSRGEPLATSPADGAAPASTAYPVTGPATPSARAHSEEAPVASGSAENLAADEFIVRSPMLGTFYRAPKPGDGAFVQEGQLVGADAVLCIIEVMKLMNSVPAGEAGVIQRVLVRDGALVEYDQPLFVLRRAS
jgi:acetyl-CoA carboxylase biotin carboxyl carrier protein|tara:strand:- start:8741 stop:9238 length:498 start_codon:yes stop_codon:yes gene_type:complete